MKAPVSHHSDGRSSWITDTRGFVRWRGIILSILITLLLTVLTTTGAPWWVPLLPDSSVELKYVVISTIAIWGVGISIGLIYLRFRTIRSLRVKFLLHQLAHKSRNVQTSINKGESVDLRTTVQEYAKLVQDYFKELIPHKDIQVSIRLAKEENGSPCYVTVARTSGLTPQREKISTPLQADKGLARFFQSQANCTGILIYHDLIEASKIDAYELAETDRKYPDEIKTLMVAGMNGWDGEKESMLGILYITSSHTNVFHPKHTDSLGYAADIGALLVSMITTSGGKDIQHGFTGRAA